MSAFTVNQISDYKGAFIELERLLSQSNIVMFKGELGAGKTTFVKEFLKFKYKLSDQDLVKAGVSSPTFSIQNQYEISGDTITHFDFYRIESNDYDLEDNLEDLEISKISFIEWPEKVNFANAISGGVLVSLSLIEDGKRFITIKN